MEQAGSYLSIFVSLLFHTYRENFDHGLHLSPVLYRAIKQLIVGETSRFTDNTSLCIVSLFLIAAGANICGCRSHYQWLPEPFQMGAGANTNGCLPIEEKT